MICIKIKQYKDYRTKNKLVRIDYTTLDLLKDEYVTTNKTYNDIIESRLKEYEVMNQFIKDLNNLITRNNSNNISVNRIKALKSYREINGLYSVQKVIKAYKKEVKKIIKY